MKTFRRPFLTLLRKILVLSLFTFLMARGACPAWFLGFLIAVALLQGFGFLIMKNRHLFVTLRISHINAAVQFAWLFLLSLDVTHPQFQLPAAFVLLGYCFLTSLQVLVFFRYLFRAKGTLNRLFPMDSFSSLLSSTQLLALTLLCLSAKPACAGDRAVRWLEQYFPLAHFQIGGLVTFGGGSYSVGPQFSWNPTLVLGPIYLRGDLGVAWQHGTAVKSEVVSSYQLLAGIGVDTGMIELGGGIQMSHASSTSDPIATVNLVYPFLPKKHFIFERVYLGYSACFRSGQILHEGRLGLGMGF